VLIGIGVLILLLQFALEYIDSIIGTFYGIIVVVSIIACVVYIKSINK